MHSASEIIDLLGGTFAVADIFNIKPPSVSDWKTHGIPEDRLIRLAPLLERKGNPRFTRKSLFPYDYQHIWPELVEVPISDQIQSKDAA